MVVYGRAVKKENRDLHAVYLLNDGTGCLSVVDYKSANPEPGLKIDLNFRYPLAH